MLALQRELEGRVLVEYVEKLGSSRASYAGRKIDLSDHSRIGDLMCEKGWGIPENIA